MVGCGVDFCSGGVLGTGVGSRFFRAGGFSVGASGGDADGGGLRGLASGVATGPEF